MSFGGVAILSRNKIGDGIRLGTEYGCVRNKVGYGIRFGTEKVGDGKRVGTNKEGGVGIKNIINISFEKCT